MKEFNVSIAGYNLKTIAAILAFKTGEDKCGVMVRGEFSIRELLETRAMICDSITTTCLDFCDTDDKKIEFLKTLADYDIKLLDDLEARFIKMSAPYLADSVKTVLTVNKKPRFTLN